MLTQLNELYKILILVRDKEKTGHVYLYFNSESQIATARMSIFKGVLTEIICAGDSTYNNNVNFINQPIKKAIFLPSSSVINETSNDGLVNITELIQIVKQIIDTGLLPDDENNNVSMEDEIHALFARLFNPDIAKKVNSLAKKHSPINEPLEFLNSCKKILDVMIGDEKAKEVLSSYYSRIIE